MIGKVIVISIILFLVFVMYATGKIIDSCEKHGGVYVQREDVCARVDGKGFIINY